MDGFRSGTELGIRARSAKFCLTFLAEANPDLCRMPGSCTVQYGCNCQASVKIPTNPNNSVYEASHNKQKAILFKIGLKRAL